MQGQQQGLQGSMTHAELQWGYIWRNGLHPRVLVQIFVHSLSAPRNQHFVLLQLLALLPPLVLVPTGLDWAWLGHVRPLPAWGSTMGGIALGLGMLVPALLPLLMFIAARSRGDVDLAKRAVQVARAVLLGLIYVTVVKAITGREHPPPMNENLGSPCVVVHWGYQDGDCSTPRNGSLSDSSRNWWWTSAHNPACDHTPFSPPTHQPSIRLEVHMFDTISVPWLPVPS